MDNLDWAQGQWLNEPPEVHSEADSLRLRTAYQSDLWRETSYGFTRDTGHGLLHPLADGQAMEVDVTAEYSEQFDQAGMLLWSGPSNWVKCGIEFADGSPQLGAVVTAGQSDWSAHPVPGWDEGVTSLRLSRAGNALTIRARRAGQSWQLVRLAPIDPEAPWRAGPYAASPSRAGLTVEFSGWRTGPADSSLH